MRRWSAAVRRGLAGAVCAGGIIAAAGVAHAQQTPALSGVRLSSKPGGVLGIMGYNMIPDGTANALRIDQGVGTDDNSDSRLVLGQIGAGFTWSDSFPLYLEGYIGYARYDPRFVFSGGEDMRLTPARWNNVTATVGVGYDIRLMEGLYLRPIINGALGYAASDASLFGAWLSHRTDQDIAVFNGGQLNVWGLGGSLTLAYYDRKPARDIDVELRYTEMHLETFGDTTAAARGTAEARALSLWARLRWPTGVEVFGGPLRWVIEGTNSYFFGDQREALGFGWLAKVGGGLEIDVASHEIGAFGLYLSRVRLLGRYVFGEHNVRGFSIGIGMSF